MLSALGSFEDRYNPRWYWVFSAAMIYCGLCMVPVMLYVRRRLAAVSRWGASVGSLFFLSGCAAITLTGLFPYAHRDFLGWQLAHLHMNAAALITASFALGVCVAWTAPAPGPFHTQNLRPAGGASVPAAHRPLCDLHSGDGRRRAENTVGFCSRRRHVSGLLRYGAFSPAGTHCDLDPHRLRRLVYRRSAASGRGGTDGQTCAH